MNRKREIFDLLLLSFLTLFAELVFIRYVTSNIYLLSYYKNAILLSIFLGIGTGFMISREKRNYIELLPVATLILLYLIINFHNYLRIDIDFGSRSESIWPEFWANTKAKSVPMLGVLTVSYVLIALYFIPFGQETARRMKTFKPLLAYSVNIAGAIAGIAVFELIGRFWITPIIWFAIVLVPLLWLMRGYTKRTSYLINLFAVLASLFLLYSAQTAFEFWSPYSKIKLYSFSSQTYDQG
ncbi:MAG TPA: hypothetical protein VEI57_12870, partial [Nitrospirota bacterium]|nr:hypothetical protein [Nitrospirota bacterium]